MRSTDRETALTFATTTTTPRIYVASLSDYNAGELHGAWIDADQDPDEIHEEIRAMLAGSSQPGVEEYAIHDHEGFGPFVVGEYEDIDRVAAFATAMAGVHGEPDAFAAWVANDPYVLELHDNDPTELVDAFYEAYAGCWPSVTDYAADWIEDTGMLRDADDLIARYFDFDAFARDLELGGDIWTAPAGGGEVYVFNGNV